MNVLIEVPVNSLVLTPFNTKEQCVEYFKEWMENKEEYLKEINDNIERKYK